MKRLAVVSFTPGGQQQAERVRQLLAQPLGGSSWEVECVHKPEQLSLWCRKQFQTVDAMLFIGAMGIAVRLIAPLLESKLTDPAVLVMDELGRYVISVLSGHIGGGNELALLLAKGLKAEPVITTASDVKQRLAIDVFAKKNQLIITDMKQAKAAAAAIVAEQPVSFQCDGRVKGRLPQELSAAPEEADFQIAVTTQKREEEFLLCLVPKVFVLGIGCRRGKTLEEIEARVFEELKKCRIPIESIYSAATIDLKRDEKGLLAFCEKYQLPITFYTPEELKQVPGVYEASAFVQQTAGVDNVCERAAVRSVWEDMQYKEVVLYKADSLCKNPQEGGCLRLKKSARDGVTIALAERDWSVEFE